MDEFEKLFEDNGEYAKSQSGLLTLFDGLVQGNKLFILTTNETGQINENLQNRPGRVYYHIKFCGAGDDVIEQYCKENLTNQNWTDQIKSIKTILNDSFSFDVLKAIIEESNRYKEEPLECVKILNITPETVYGTYIGKVYKNGKSFVDGPNGQKEEVVIEDEYRLNILSEFEVSILMWDRKEEDWNWKELNLGPHCLKSISNNTITYEASGLTFIFTRMDDHINHWSSYQTKFEKK
ncbi:MAG: hypothetical protein FWC29_06125 [Methanomassiliicoccaceae archaeon]|nr:hypothetical protein [Methanomassiliicoccaceae archaeon]